MITDDREDLGAIVSLLNVKKAAQSSSQETKVQVVETILEALDEKKDAYNGIITSIIYVVDSQDNLMIDTLRNGLSDSITCKKMKYGGKMFISKTLKRLTDERPLFVEHLFEQIILSSSKWSEDFDEDHDVLRVQIISLKAIRQAEQSRFGRPTILSQEDIDQLCSKAIFTCDDSTKVDTLSLILESRSTTKPLGDKELNLFKVFFQDALSLQDPGLRQIFITLINKLMIRIKSSHRVVQRDYKNYPKDVVAQTTSRYMEFLTWLIEFCFDSIYCDAYFGSFILTISTLNLIITHITFDDMALPIRALFEERRCYDSILSCLTNSFEENKKLALNLLLLLPENENFFDKNLSRFEEIAYYLVSSVNPAHSLTCQFIFKMLIGFRSKQKDLTKNQLLLHYLSKLIIDVEEGVKETHIDLVASLKYKPIFPKLTCIRALLDEVDIAAIENDREEWKKLAKRIVIVSIEACKAVSAIVCNLNPETIGHLPMDLKPLDVNSLSKTLNISLKVSDSTLNTITSQMLLICGWKTIKECSLSMGTMCVHFWWPMEQTKMRREKFPGLKSEPILESAEIIRMLEFFDHYLRHLRHRGAFEQAYNGFLLVTRRIWHDEHFRGLLNQTLLNIMNDFKSDALDNAKNLKAYVTRRSGGLPFIIQAILNSEHKHDSKTLRWVMDSLFEILESDNAELFQRIHCLNILKALIKEHSLGEKVLSYVGKTFALTIESFKSESFPIRNCANMLLKATVDRTFGTNRLRDNIHRRNQLSFGRFFTECPSLHSSMLTTLKQGIVDKRYLAAIHVVFILLSRLRPSLNPGENFTHDKIVYPFIEPIVKLALSCPDYKLRELAAEQAVRLDKLCSENFEPTLKQHGLVSSVCTGAFKKLSLNDRNKAHGTLSIIKYSIESANLGADQEDMMNHALLLAREILTSDLSTSPSSLKLISLNLVETCYIIKRTHLNWLFDVKTHIENKLFFHSNFSEHQEIDPFKEAFAFKYLTVFLMSYFPLDNQDDTRKKLDSVVDLTIDLILAKPNRVLSVNLQASLIRFLRQLMNDTDNFVEKLLDELDMDLTATHITPFDRLKQSVKQNMDLKGLTKYCQQNQLKDYLLQSKRLLEIFKFKRYYEFSAGLIDNKSKFSAKKTNTARSVELLALSLVVWDTLDLTNTSVWLEEGEENISKLTFLTQIILDLPDCDIKCLVLLCAGKLFLAVLGEIKRGRRTSIKILETFSKILDDLAEGDHSLTIRETCAEVLRIILKDTIETSCKSLVPSLINLLSAIIKLSQDEEHQVRLSSQKVMLSLKDCVTLDYKSNIDISIGSRLDNLIRLVTTRLFNPNINEDINNCIGLLMRIIFNQNSYSMDASEERESLFDKTKLNTFADHVTTIQSSLKGLELFLERRNDELRRFNLSSLSLLQDILLELSLVDSHSNDDDTGDYSWRIKKVMAANERDLSFENLNTDKLFESFLENMLKSLHYFSNAYWTMLTDQTFASKELNFYKRVVLVKFVITCTPQTSDRSVVLLNEIKDAIQRIYANTCSTTLVRKSLDLIEQIDFNSVQYRIIKILSYPYNNILTTTS